MPSSRNVLLVCAIAGLTTMACARLKRIGSAPSRVGAPGVLAAEPPGDYGANDVTVGGVVRKSCLGSPPARSVPVQLVNEAGRVLDEAVSGIDGSFILRAPLRADPNAARGHRWYVVFSEAKVKLPPSASWYSVGSYRAEFFVPCDVPSDPYAKPRPTP